MSGVRHETQEAQAAARALGEEFGVHVPRHLAKLLATLPQLGSVLAGMSGLAIAGLGVEVFQKAIEKVSELANEMEVR
jgi:hypothetical protein